MKNNLVKKFLRKVIEEENIIPNESAKVQFPPHYHIKE